LSGNEFYARGLLQSAATHLDLELYEDAEREFLMALSLEGANETLAAYGLARVFFASLNYAEAVRVLTEHTHDESQGAWSARRLLGNAFLRLGKHEDALRELRRTVPLVPAHLPQEREALEDLIRNVERRARRPR
jgi:tetratricopeptide (TPR) repeat protein